MPVLKTLKKNELQEGRILRIDVSGKYIVFTNKKGNFYAIDSVCSQKRRTTRTGYFGRNLCLAGRNIKHT
jgi:nitrite reductase/ring-hydroxylating ferredoxin subunit